MNNNELMHYGVLGMKWGMHRARKTGNTYKYKSFSTKRYERKAAKTNDQNKKRIYSNRAKESAKIDAKEQKIAANQSLGKTVASRLLLNSGFGAKSYQRIRAMTGISKGKAAVFAFLDSGLTGGIGHRVAKGIVIRSHDNDNSHGSSSKKQNR